MAEALAQPTSADRDRWAAELEGSRAANATQRSSAPQDPLQQGSSPKPGGARGKAALANQAANVADKIAKGGKLSQKDVEQAAAVAFKEYVVIAIGVPSLIAFPATLIAAPLLTIYWIASIFGVKGTVPSTITEHAVMIVVFLLEILTLILLIFFVNAVSCSLDTACIAEFGFSSVISYFQSLFS